MFSYVQCIEIWNQYVALSRLQFYLIDESNKANITEYAAFSKYWIKNPKTNRQIEFDKLDYP